LGRRADWRNAGIRLITWASPARLDTNTLPVQGHLCCHPTLELLGFASSQQRSAMQ
jgi:hypothetical protein